MVDESKQIQQAHFLVQKGKYKQAKSILKNLTSKDAKAMLDRVVNLEAAVAEVKRHKIKGVNVRVIRKRKGFWGFIMRLFGQ